MLHRDLLAPHRALEASGEPTWPSSCSIPKASTSPYADTEGDLSCVITPRRCRAVSSSGLPIGPTAVAQGVAAAVQGSGLGPVPDYLDEHLLRPEERCPGRW